jgi:hypothetical protein
VLSSPASREWVPASILFRRSSVLIKSFIFVLTEEKSEGTI